jgi:DNA-binding transcriptional ArsR family regulator
MATSVFKALAHPVRREILALLGEGPMTSGDIAEQFVLAWPTMSRHLAVLKDAKLISAEKTGTSIQYRANASVLEEAAAVLLSLVNRKSKRKAPTPATGRVAR